VGRVVELQGLTSKPALNGRSGHVVAYRDGGRYGVTIDGVVIDVKVVNLKLEQELDWSDMPFREAEDCIILEAPPTKPAINRSACLLKLQGAMDDMNIAPEVRGEVLKELFAVLEKRSETALPKSGDKLAAESRIQDKTTPMKGTGVEQSSSHVKDEVNEAAQMNEEKPATVVDKVSTSPLEKKSNDCKEDTPKHAVFRSLDHITPEVPKEVKEMMSKMFMGDESSADPAKELSQV
jgi:hypothetical protein